MTERVVDVEVQIHVRTDRAILVSLDGDKDNAVWLPLSAAQVQSQKGRIVEVEVQEWLAKDRGLI